MVKTVAVTSGKGGVGKSTCSIELAIALSKQGKRVLLIDMDEGMRCLDMLLSVSERLLFDLSDAVAGRELSSCLLTHERYRGISLIAAPLKKGLIPADKLRSFLEGISPEEFDVIIADLPAGFDKASYKGFPLHTEFICVCNPNAVSVRDAAFVGKALKDCGFSGRLLINRFDLYFIKNPVFKSLDEIIDQTGMRLIGIAPESEDLTFAFLNGKFPQKGRAYKAFERIANRLYDRGKPLPRLSKI
jgi:septum site-determining protein MinD